MSAYRLLPRFTLMICCVLSLVGANHLRAQEAKNVTTQRRTEPNALAAKAGSAIEWQKDLDSALKLATEKQRPIFWYVPTIPNTFMDRKPEIDRYMKAGPFSWPSIIEQINSNFVPLVLTPTIGQARKYDLLPYKFVEPGFVILQPDGTKSHAIDHLTTLHPHWFSKLIGNTIQRPQAWSDLAGNANRSALDDVWKKAIANRFRLDNSDWQKAFQDTDLAMESQLLAGMNAFRSGRQAEAKSIWEAASQAHPEHPLAWKAANEAQGIGPFVRGFEVFSPLPEKSWDAGSASLGSAAPVATFTSQEIWDRSTEFLIDMQDESGGYFDSDYDFGGYDSMSNIYTAVTSLVGLALMESQSHCQEAALKAQIQNAIAKSLSYVVDDKHLNLVDRDEILWAQAYRTQFLAAAIRRLDRADLKPALQSSVEQLQKLQLKNGSWYHEYSNAFVTGTALIALYDAKQAGATVDMAKIESGLKRLKGQRFGNGAYPYAERNEARPSKREEPVEGSVGRVCICQLARKVWGEVDAAQLAADVKLSLENHKYLAKGFKYDNHTSTFAYGGFFFWYDMHARAEAIAAIDDQGNRKSYADAHRDLIMELPELDGCFVDSHELGRAYGTAMALISLSRVE